MTADTVDGRTLAEQVYDYLRGSIIEERFAPASELNEVAIADELGISRGPVREAMGRLRAEGLVDVRPRRGAVVASLSKEEFVNAYQVRIALELLAIRQGVPRRTPETLVAIEKLTRELETKANTLEDEDYYRLNVTVHRLICELSGNDALMDIYDRLMTRMARYRRRSMRLTADRSQAAAEHRAILEAVQSGKVEEAESLMDTHLGYILRQVERLSEDDWERLSRS